MKLNLKPILFVVGCLMMTGSYAQKVIIENNKVIIDASALRNSTKVKKARTTDGAYNKLGTNDATNIGSKVSDEKVYYKFEVDKEEKGYNFFWDSAVYTCQSLTKEWGRMAHSYEGGAAANVSSETRIGGVPRIC